MPGRHRQNAFTLIELMVALVLAGLLLGAISGIVKNALGTDEIVEERNLLMRDARFAMQRMTRAVQKTSQLILPQSDKSATDWRENVREETVPASSPEGSSTKATAALAIALATSVDLNADGFPDADNDRDGNVNEDFPSDIVFDYAPGIYQIDDGGDGNVDEELFGLNDADDDERSFVNDEDPINGVDDDGDGSVDEDPGADMNGDGAPGVAGVDDDGDGSFDEGDVADDDEDGVVDEDWLDVVVFFLQGDQLIERHPVPWDESANGTISGRDFIESVIAEGVTRFRVERPIANTSGAQLVYLTLELTGSVAGSVTLDATIRVGGGI